MRPIKTPNAEGSDPLDVVQPGRIFDLDLGADPVSFPDAGTDADGGVFMIYVPAGEQADMTIKDGEVSFPLLPGYWSYAFDGPGEITLTSSVGSFTAKILKNKQVPVDPAPGEL